MKIDKIKSKISPNAKKVWESLTKEQQEKIQKNNPFTVERNWEISKLTAKGVSSTILAAITGLSRTAICTITKDSGPIAYGALATVKEDVKILQRVIGRLGYHISLIDKHIGGG